MHRNNLVGENIRARRMELGLTQEELSKRIGYKTKSTVNKVEKGINDVNQSTLVKYAHALSTTPERLMGWDTEIKIDNTVSNDANIRLQKMLDDLDGIGLSIEEIHLIKQYRRMSEYDRNIMKMFADRNKGDA